VNIIRSIILNWGILCKKIFRPLADRKKDVKNFLEWKEGADEKYATGDVKVQSLN
jgi:hypothetical protein